MRLTFYTKILKCETFLLLYKARNLFGRHDEFSGLVNAEIHFSSFDSDRPFVCTNCGERLGGSFIDKVRAGRDESVSVYCLNVKGQNDGESSPLIVIKCENVPFAYFNSKYGLITSFPCSYLPV